MRSFSCSRVTLLFSSALLPSRKTITFRGSPLLVKVRSIPRASAITIRKTPTVSPMVNAVARVLDLRTVMLRRLYFSGSAMIRSSLSELNLIFFSLFLWERVGVRAYGHVDPIDVFVVESHSPATRQIRKIASARKPSSPALLPKEKGE